MSNHKTPVTDLERAGLTAHGLARYIGQPNQLVDVFRQGINYALNHSTKVSKVDEVTRKYRLAELALVLLPNRATPPYGLSLQITSDVGRTKNLGISDEEFNKIMEILTE